MLGINSNKIIRDKNFEKKLVELRSKIRIAKAGGNREAVAQYELELAKLELEKRKILHL